MDQEEPSMRSEPASNLNYSQIARETGLSVSFISRIMRGQRNPSVHNLVKISKAIKINLNELIKMLGIE